MMGKDNRNNTTSSRVMRKGELLPAPSNKSSKKKKSNKKKKAVIVLVSILVVLAVVAVGGYAYWRSLLGNVSREEIDLEEIAVNEEVFDDVINIALFGVDSRADVMEGRSDAIIILTIDQKHDKIKMSSIARDTYVAMDGHGNDKLTHAYVYGGATLAIKTLNQNFNMDIQDYATVNFYGLVEIIDEIGGVMIDVDADEMSVMNNHIMGELRRLGMPCDNITTTGLQRLSGAQALAYARNRYSGGSDVERGNRQKEVLAALYDEVKNVSITKYPSLINMILKNCETSLSDSEITNLALWAVKSSPSIENLSLPDAECNPRSGDAAMINGTWYYIYDLDIATQKLHNFINEEDSTTNKEDTADQTTEE